MLCLQLRERQIQKAKVHRRQLRVERSLRFVGFEAGSSGSPVAFELLKRRTRADLAEVVREFAGVGDSGTDVAVRRELLSAGRQPVDTLAAVDDTVVDGPAADKGEPELNTVLSYGSL
jgi:hypothetical protein